MTPQSTTIRVLQKPVPPFFPIRLDEQVAGSKDSEHLDQDELVLEILESTQSIRRRTDNREILAILDEIVWLARSI
jgi:hypothetical protein